MSEATRRLGGSQRRRRGWSMTPRVLAAGGIAVCIAALLSVYLPSRSVVAGIADAGPLTTISLPAVKALFDLGAAMTLGWLVAAAVWIPRNSTGQLTVAAFRAVRAASLSAWLWLAAALALLPLTLSDILGRPLSKSTDLGTLLQAVGVFETMRGYLIAAIAALLVAVAGRLVLRTSSTGLLLAVAVIGAATVAFTGHASGARNHDIAVDLMIYHLLGSGLWVGGLVAVVGLARQRIPMFATVLQRYSTTALVVFVAVALSGVGNALIRLNTLGDLVNTDYGRLVAAKAVLLVLLGLFGAVQRRRILPAVGAGKTRPLIALASLELLVMAAAMAVAATLGRTAPPPEANYALSDALLVLGFDLPGPPTVWKLLTQWRFDFLLGTAAIVAAVGYLRGVRRLRGRGIPWSAKRTTAWLTGCGLVLLSTSSGLDRYAQSQFSLHMIVHMIIGMLAPIVLVMGGPVTLALRVLRPAGRGQPPRLREAITAVLHSRALRMASHPGVALPLFVGSFYAIYFTDLFEILISSHVGHLVMNVHLLTVGYLYYWLVIGIDPAPRRFQPIAKLGLLMLTIPFHAIFGLSLMNSQGLIAADYYQRLALPWVPELLADQKLGGAIAWALADIPTAVVILALVSQWFRHDEREARRTDRRARQSEDAELAAYNAMLEKLHERDQRRSTSTARSPISPAPVPADRLPSPRAEP